ncbi:MAG: prolyl oligopeptidase family serine peptidase [Actinomycetota bacterium]
MDEQRTPAWEQRHRAPTLSMPDWAPNAPDRVVYQSTESAVWQVHTWDSATGARRKVTDHPVGVVTGSISSDGADALWWQDETGDESGRWFAAPFAGGEPRPFLDGIPVGWNEGFAQAPGVVAASVSDRDGFAVYVSVDGGPAKQTIRSTDWLRVSGPNDDGYNRGGLSADGSMLCLQHCEGGDMLHPALRVIDPRTASVIADIGDDGKGLSTAAWSPVAGDGRLAVIHERTGEPITAIWEPATNAWTDLPTGLDGEIVALDWWPDGSALLFSHLVEGRHRLYRFDLASSTLTSIAHPEGQISGGRVRPDGTVWFRHANGANAPRVLDDRGSEVLAAVGERAVAGRPYTSFRFDNPHGQSVHGFYVTPEGDGPFPVFVRPHGGPTWLEEDRWSPEVQAYVDAGFAVAMINFRGSTGYGAAWRDALIGDIGGPELEDLNAGLDWLTQRGIADPTRAVIGGWSWGGYLTLMELGKHPELWLCGVAGIPVGDYELSYDDMSPVLQAYDRALLGGTPEEVPELMRDRNPIYFADNVRVPVLFIIGENDSRCPFRQAMAYVDKLAARGHPPEVYLFGTGHGSFEIEEDVRQIRTILEFLAAHVPGVQVPTS